MPPQPIIFRRLDVSATAHLVPRRGGGQVRARPGARGMSRSTTFPPSPTAPCSLIRRRTSVGREFATALGEQFVDQLAVVDMVWTVDVVVPGGGRGEAQSVIHRGREVFGTVVDHARDRPPWRRNRRPHCLPRRRRPTAQPSSDRAPRHTKTRPSARSWGIRVCLPIFPPVRLLCTGYSRNLSYVAVADGEATADRLNFLNRVVTIAASRTIAWSLVTAKVAPVCQMLLS
jgi:hypothetical protein